MSRGRRTRLSIALVVLFLVSATTWLLINGPGIGTLVSHDLTLDTSQLSTLASLSKHSLPLTQDASDTRRLHVFMPADAPHINLCKTIMSAVALGYPLPTILNWNGEFNRPHWHLAGSHIAKLESLLSAIEWTLAHRSVNNASEDDLVVMIDAYDIWFQLPPTALIQRFHRLNQQADERSATEWSLLHPKDDSSFPISPPRQSIIVTAAKDCHPGPESGSNPHYDHWPDSPMPVDLYGPDTDTAQTVFFDSARKWSKVRPRCVNSGLIMGTMGAMRDALLRCQEKIDRVAARGRQLWSDQALFAEVIGEQELWREALRDLKASWNSGTGTARPRTSSADVVRVRDAALQRGRRFEFGIGLDYNFTTVPPTCSAEDDAGFVVINDKAALAAGSREAGVPAGQVRIKDIPKELKNHDALAPEDPLRSIPWRDVPLFTDYYFGVVPVGIHHNAYIRGLKPWRLAHWWDKMWFHPYLRRLVQKNLEPGPRTWPLASVMLADVNVSYWAPSADVARKVTVLDTLNETTNDRYLREVEWAAVCQKGTEPWENILFGDGKGPLM